jgi:hypothetical protein
MKILATNIYYKPNYDFADIISEICKVNNSLGESNLPAYASYECIPNVFNAFLEGAIRDGVVYANSGLPEEAVCVGIKKTGELFFEYKTASGTNAVKITENNDTFLVEISVVSSAIVFKESSFIKNLPHDWAKFEK